MEVLKDKKNHEFKLNTIIKSMEHMDANTSRGQYQRSVVWKRKATEYKIEQKYFFALDSQSKSFSSMHIKDRLP